MISVDSIRTRINKLHPRTRKAQSNIIAGLFLKGGGMLISLLLVPLTIDYLSKSTYGTWLTISSIVTMMTLMDIGVGNGLRNKFSEAVAEKNYTLAQGYVSTAYFVFGLIQGTIIVIFCLINNYIPWQKILNSHIDISALTTAISIIVVTVSMKMLLDILLYVALALQESKIVNLLAFISNLLILVGVYLLTLYTKQNLILLSIISGVGPLAVMIFVTLIMYNGRFRLYRPTFKTVNLSHARDIMSLGYKFFIIQIAVIVIFYSDNLIITRLFGPTEVAVYNIAYKYFNIANILFSIVLTPYWSAFTEARVKNDVDWMVSTFTHLKKIWMIFTFIIIVMILMSDIAYHLWIGDRVIVPFLLSINMGIFSIIFCWSSIAVSIINGSGKVQMQLIYSSVGALFNIPLAIYLGEKLNMGSAGVIVATNITLVSGAVLGAVQAKKLLKNEAKGIWNK